MGLWSFLLNGFPLSEMSPVSHMFLSPIILWFLLKNALSTDGSFRNRPFQNWLDNDLAAAAIASGPTEASLTGERLGIFKEVDNLDRHSIFQVVSSGLWNSFGSQDIFREFQKHCRLGIDRPPLLWGSCAYSSLTTIFFCCEPFHTKLLIILCRSKIRVCDGLGMTWIKWVTLLKASDFTIWILP